MKSKHIVFVHGLFGWGPGELGGLPYWGDALAQFQPTFATHETKCGPISSFHDRACEVFAQIMGCKVDYGEKHSADAGHARTSCDFPQAPAPLVPDWSENNPVILVGHSAGAHTCMHLQQLLADDFWNIGANANWVEAIVSVAGVINGSTLTYMAGCDEGTGKLAGAPSTIIRWGVDWLRRFANSPGNPVGHILNPCLDQWTGAGEEPLSEVWLKKIDNSSFVKGEDNLGFDLSLQGCLKANSKFSTHPGTYYLSIVTSKTVPLPIVSGARPIADMNPLLWGFASYQGVRTEFNLAPIEGWGSGDLTIDKWRENDGAVSSVSQRYPFTAGRHPIGGEGIFQPANGRLEKGKWYFERAEHIAQNRFDHLDAVIGARLNLQDRAVHGAQQRLYSRLSGLLHNL